MTGNYKYSNIYIELTLIKMKKYILIITMLACYLQGFTNNLWKNLTKEGK